jgi:hypothetical protein
VSDWITRTIGRMGYRDSGPSQATFRSHVTTRGALLGMFAICLAGCLLGAWLHADAAAGIGFIMAGILAPLYARREALLYIVISAPIIFLLAEIIAQLATAQGSSSRGTVISMLEGTILTLASVAPWLFAGTVICVAAAMMRGLPQCIRDLRAGLRGEAGAASPRGDVRTTSPRAAIKTGGPRRGSPGR